MNAKILKEWFDIIDNRINMSVPKLKFNKSNQAKVVSNDGTTLTITFLDDLINEISGVPYLSGQTIVAEDVVIIIYINNSPKSTDWVAIKLA